MRHKISDLKVGDQIIIVDEGSWRGTSVASKIGKITSIDLYHGRAYTDIGTVSLGYKFVNDTDWPFRLAPNGI